MIPPRREDPTLIRARPRQASEIELDEADLVVLRCDSARIRLPMPSVGDETCLTMPFSRGMVDLGSPFRPIGGTSIEPDPVTIVVPTRLLPPEDEAPTTRGAQLSPASRAPQHAPPRASQQPPSRSYEPSVSVSIVDHVEVFERTPPPVITSVDVGPTPSMRWRTSLAALRGSLRRSPLPGAVGLGFKAPAPPPSFRERVGALFSASESPARTAVIFASALAALVLVGWLVSTGSVPVAAAGAASTAETAPLPPPAPTDESAAAGTKVVRFGENDGVSIGAAAGKTEDKRASAAAKPTPHRAASTKTVAKAPAAPTPPAPKKKSVEDDLAAAQLKAAMR